MLHSGFDVDMLSVVRFFCTVYGSKPRLLVYSYVSRDNVLQISERSGQNWKCRSHNALDLMPFTIIIKQTAGKLKIQNLLNIGHSL